jgi:hypothetical protein
VNLLIGKGERALYVHASVLYKSSQFFQAALKTDWAEGQQREVKLPEEEFEAFNTYVQWMYKRAIPTKFEKNSSEDKDKQQSYIHLSKLYVLGERLMDCEFQNQVVDAIVATARDQTSEGTRYKPIGEVVNIIYENTPKPSPGRKLMAQIWYEYGRADWFAESNVKLNYEFMEDVMSALLGKGKRGDSFSDGVPGAYYKVE